MKNKLLILILIISTTTNAQNLKAFEEDSLWGYKDQELVVIKPQFQYTVDFQYGKGVVLKDRKAGVINMNSEVIIPFKFDMIHLLNDSLIRIMNRTDMRGKYEIGVVTESGKEILPKLYNSIYLKDEKLIVEKRRDSLILSGEHAGMTSIKTTHGIFSLNGEPLLEPIYDWFEWLDESTIKVRKGQFQALVKTNGHFVTELKYTAFGDYHYGKAKIRVDSLYGFVDRQGVEVIPPKFYSVSSFYRDTTVYRMHNSKVGFINGSGIKIFEGDYEILKYPHLDCAAARKNDKWGLISLQGEMLIPFEHDDYVREFEGVIAFKKNNKWAIFNNIGERKTEFEFDSILIFGSKESKTGGYWKIKENKYNQPIALVTKEEQKGVININGDLIIPFGLTREEFNREFDKLEKIR
jgi:hypothetical protein